MPSPHAPPLIAIDTSGARPYVAMRTAHGDVTVAGNPGAHGEDLEALVVQCCELSQCSVEDIATVVVGAGPGSFTGLRIGYAFAKGLCLANGATLRTIDSLWAVAAAFDSPALAVASDARRAEYFFGIYRLTPQPEVCMAPRIVSLSELAETLVNSGVQVEGIVLREGTPHLGESALPVPLCAESEVGRGLLRLAQNATTPAGTGIAQLSQLHPHYLRPVAARSIAERAQDLSSLTPPEKRG